LRAIRETFGFRLVDVEEATAAVAHALKNSEMSIPSSSLSDIETKGVLPTIYRLYALSLVYRTDFAELLRIFGIDLGSPPKVDLPKPPATVFLRKPPLPTTLQVPVLEAETDLAKTFHVGRMVQTWGPIAISKLQDLMGRNYIYGYVGTADRTMYPLIPPGSFVQVDPAKCKVTTSPWRSELERPIYFLETREGWICSWCNVFEDRYLLVEPHPLSGVAQRRYLMGKDIEVLGTVVGVAMQLLNARLEPKLRESQDIQSNAAPGRVMP
jgi:hypothetical protein